MCYSTCRTANRLIIHVVRRLVWISVAETFLFLYTLLLNYKLRLNCFLSQSLRVCGVSSLVFCSTWDIFVAPGMCLLQLLLSWLIDCTCGVVILLLLLPLCIYCNGDVCWISDVFFFNLLLPLIAHVTCLLHPSCLLYLSHVYFAPVVPIIHLFFLRLFVSMMHLLCLWRVGCKCDVSVAPVTWFLRLLLPKME